MLLQSNLQLCPSEQRKGLESLDLGGLGFVPLAETLEKIFRGYPTKYTIIHFLENNLEIIVARK